MLSKKQLEILLDLYSEGNIEVDEFIILSNIKVEKDLDTQMVDWLKKQNTVTKVEDNNQQDLPNIDASKRLKYRQDVYSYSGNIDIV